MTFSLVKLEEVVDILSGFAFKSELFNDSRGMPLIRIRDVVRGYSDTFYSGEYLSQYVINNDEMIIGMDGSFNVARWSGGPALLNQRVCKIIPDPKKIAEGYLFHFLPAVLKKIEDATPFMTVKHLSAKDLKAEMIPLPPLPEQRRIAAILDKADALRTKRRESLAQLDELTQSIFIEMFGDPVRGNGRYPIATVESIAAPIKHAIVDGPFGSSMKPDDYREAGIPVIRIANITKEGEFTDRNLLHIDKELFEKLKRSSVLPRDVLVSRVGTIGNTCIFPEGIGDALLSTTGVCKITPDKKRMIPEFLHQAILQPSFQGQIHKSASTSVQKYFNLSALKGWRIIVPPLPIQETFVAQLEKIGAQREALKKSAEDFDFLFTSLQHRAFRGEL